jgi:hypothetical protein
MNVMLIKGAALSILVYQQPWYTVHDVDLLIKPRRDELSASDLALIQAMFKKLPGIEYGFFAHNDVTMNGVLPVDFLRIWHDAIQLHYRDQPLCVMCPEHMLLTACINICRKRFFRLKSLLAVVEIVNHYPALNWHQVVTQAREWRCNRIVYTALVVARMTVGCQVPEPVFAELAISPVRRALLPSLIQGLLDHTSLTATYPFLGPYLFGRRLTVPLLLAYISYTPAQVRQKLIQKWQTLTAFRQAKAG